MILNALIVDDNMIDRTILSKHLNNLDIIGIECKDAYEALDKLETMSIEIIFLDIKMPAINGFELLKRLNKYCQRNNIPIIMMSACRLDPQGVIQSFRLGASDFIVKPTELNTLRDKVENLKEKGKISRITKVKFPNNNESQMVLPCQLINLDPHGITAVTQHKVNKGEIIKINNPVFSRHELYDLELTVEKVEQDDDNEYIFFLSFKNTPDHQREKIMPIYKDYLKNYKNHIAHDQEII
ncbi:MAG: response regulator [Bdellovibrionales bacterium]|nr:response regulator [Bdellovibrionales bacterium]NQZ17707.1 response regulator [Bdellovibrionales bacterium]